MQDKEQAMQAKASLVATQETLQLALHAKDAELERARTKTYEEIPKMDNVYINKEASQVGTDVHKIGKAINPKVREATFNTASAQGCRMIYTRPTHNAKLVEDVVRDVMKRYHIGGLGGTEHYNNNVEHSIDVIDITCVVVDTLASSFEYMKRDDMIRTVIKKLKIEMSEEDDDVTSNDEPLPAACCVGSSNLALETVNNFVATKVVVVPRVGLAAMSSVSRSEIVDKLKQAYWRDKGLLGMPAAELKNMVDNAMRRCGYKYSEDTTLESGERVKRHYLDCDMIGQ